jgi:hypothetical protein
VVQGEGPVTRWEYWRYLPGRRVKHALREETAHTGVAECGAAPRFGLMWFGTGSQDEYERVEALPACKRCVAKGYRP